jgi:hypothetical protein
MDPGETLDLRYTTTYKERRSVWFSFVLPDMVPPLWIPFAHDQRFDNVNVAVRNRGLALVPKMKYRTQQVLYERVDFLCNKLRIRDHVYRWSLDSVANSFSGAKKKAYLSALEQFSRTGWREKYGKIKVFVKQEALDPMSKNNPDPRAIWARDPIYNLHIGRYTRPIEHFVFKTKMEDWGFPGVGRVFAKGLNSYQRAAELRRKWDAFDNPVAFSIDGSRWDMHISLRAIDVEHRFYTNSFPYCSDLQKLLRYQRVNKCSTQYHRIKTKGRRMSGDMNTSLGNCLLAVIYIDYYMRSLGIRKWDILDDGDDCVVIVEYENLALFQDNILLLGLDVGQETKIENVATTFNQILFCQSKPIFTRDRWCMVRSPTRAMSKSLFTLKEDGRDPRSHLFAVMMGLFIEHRGIPVIQNFALAALHQLYDPELVMHVTSHDDYLRQRISDAFSIVGLKYDEQTKLKDIFRSFELRPSTPSDYTRILFKDSFGLDSLTQIACETQFGSVLSSNDFSYKYDGTWKLGTVDTAHQLEKWYTERWNVVWEGVSNSNFLPANAKHFTL